MSSVSAPVPSRAEITRRVLGYLEACGPNLSRRLGYAESEPHVYEPLISVEGDGVRAHPAGAWWAYQTPYSVVATLRLLEVPLLNGGEVAAWIKHLQDANGVFSSDGLGHNVRDATYNACVMLRWLGADRDASGWERARLVEMLRAQQGERPRRGHRFAQLPGDSRAEAREPAVAYACIGSLAALGEALPDPELAIAHIRSKQEAHGTFSPGWYGPARAWPDQAATVNAVRCLALLGSAPRDARACIAQVQSWQYADGGFYGYPTGDRAQTEHSSTYATATAVVALALLGALPRDVEGCRRRVMELWVPAEGGFMTGPVPDPLRGADVEVTHWGLLAMAALGMLGPAAPHWREMLMLSGR